MTPTRLNALLILLVCGCAATEGPAAKPTPSAEGFFKAATDRAADLPADEFYPRGRRMLCSIYSVGSPELERMRQDGFTAIGPYYGDQTKGKVIEKAKTSGLKCFYAVGKHVDFVKNPKYVMPTDAELTDLATQQVKAVADSPEIAVWCVANEELRHWRPDEMRWLRVTADAIRKADPRRRPVMMYDPNNRNAASLAHTVRYLDFSSKGMYANSIGFKDQRIWIRWGVEQEIGAIRQAKPPAIPIAVLWMAKDPDAPEEDALIADWTRHDVYLSLVSGAKGIIIWSGWNRRKGFERTFSKYYEGYAAAMREINGDLDLARIFLFGERRNDVTITVTSGPPTLSFEYNKETHSYPSVSHLDAACGAERYLFLVNSANVPVKAMVGGLPAAAIQMEDILARGEPRQVTGGKFEVALPRLGVTCLRFRPGPTN
ncbi:MAG: hypothetical protein AB1696_17955 [Planctomycetota bacterium]